MILKSGYLLDLRDHCLQYRSLAVMMTPKNNTSPIVKNRKVIGNLDSHTHQILNRRVWSPVILMSLLQELAFQIF